MKATPKYITLVVALAFNAYFCSFQKVNAQTNSEFFSNFSRKGKVVEFTTAPICADTSMCYAVRIVDGSSVDTLCVIPYSGKNRKRETTNWRINLKNEGLYTLRIVLKDVDGKCYQYPYDVNYKRFGYWILSVGTGDNQKNGKNKLLCSPDDAQTFVDIIQEKIDQDPEKSELLVGPKATKDSIMAAFQRISIDLESKRGNFDEESVFIYLSGHGKDVGKSNSNFQFQIKDKNSGVDGDTTLSQESITKKLDEFFEKGQDDLIVWLFVDACESDRLYQSGHQLKAVRGQNLLVFSSVIANGWKYKKKVYDCNEVKRSENLFDVVVRVKEEEGEKGELDRKAIDGLYVSFFNKTLQGIDTAVRYDELSDTLKLKYYKKELTTPGNLFPDITPSFPYEGFKRGASIESPSCQNDTLPPSSHDDMLTPVGFIDIAIGWNLSRQWNPQIGYSWPRWSVFVDFSGRKKWTNTITHTDIPESDTLARVLPSRYIIGMGLGARWYPKLFSFGKVNSGIGLVNLGLGLSAQTGIIYGEKKISEVETVKHKQSYTCITPIISIKTFVSRRHLFMWYLNVGYACYIHPCNIDQELELKSFVTNFGISIPVCFKNKTTTGGKR